jgi:hypothetical protein
MNLKKYVNNENIKLLIVQCSEYDYTVATLIEGLHEYCKNNKDIIFKCVSDSNYAKHYKDYTISEQDIEEYVKSCDFIVTTSNRWVRYDLVKKFYNINKVIFLDGSDSMDFTADPKDFVLYFKRELLKENKILNVKPFPFAAENRYFFNNNIDLNNLYNSFEKIWDNKLIKVCCLLSTDNNRNHRYKIKNTIDSKYSGFEWYVGDPVMGGTKTGIDSIVGKLHNDAYYDLLKNTKISVDAWGAGKLTGRMFESLANGCLLFQQPIDDLLYYDELKVDKEIVFYYNEGELIEKIEYYINNEKESKDIAYNGFVKLLKSHTTLSRAKYFIDTLKEKKYRR